MKRLNIDPSGKTGQEVLNELNMYLCTKMVEQRTNVKEVARKYSEKYGVSSFHASDILFSAPCSPDWDFAGNFNNLLSIFCNNTVGGLFSEYSKNALYEEIDNLKRVANKEKILKNKAFLFILNSGLLKDFEAFVASYDGETSKDIKKHTVNINYN